MRRGNFLSSTPHPLSRKNRTSSPFQIKAQKRLWFLDQLIEHIALYNIPFALNLKGKLDIGALEKALNTLINRHESLRTIFSSEEGDAHQVILPHLERSLKEIDLKKDSLLQEMIHEESNKPFNLEAGPLIRVKIIRVNSKEHILLLTLHHIISDGMVYGILFKELSHLYKCLC